MALTLTQVAVTSTATSLIAVPPGGTVTLVASAATTIGTSNTVTTSTGGFALPANVAVTWTLLDELGQSAITLYGITGTTSTVSVALSN